jgi:hypothetical protein
LRQAHESRHRMRRLSTQHCSVGILDSGTPDWTRNGASRSACHANRNTQEARSLRCKRRVIVESVAVDPESKYLQQVAVVRDKDDAALAQRVNEKLAEIKIEGGKLREIRFFPPQSSGADQGMTVVAVYDVPPTLPA